MKTRVTRNADWHLETDPRTGALVRIAHPADPHGMNWICSPAENLWFPASSGWGLGYVAMPSTGGAAAPRWQMPIKVAAGKVRYQLGQLEVAVARRLRGERVEEEYVFRNTGKTEQPVWGIGLFTPFNDNYPDARTCVTRRCNAHGSYRGNGPYVCALRIGNTAPHLGLVLTDGFLGGYSIDGRGLLTGGSNIRGTIVLNAKGMTLAPGQACRIAWTMFWHDGWDDFLGKARRIPGFVDARADHYTVTGTEKPRITVSNRRAVIGKPDGDLIKVQLPRKRETWLRVQCIDDVAALVRRRVAFIRDRQQVVDPRNRLCGALLSYDNHLGAQLCHPQWADQDEGRERIGMGVLLAQSLQRWRDAKTGKAVRLHHRFVRSKLQSPDGTVFGAVGDKAQRLYNYPWVAQLHLELYRAFGERRFLDDGYKTLRAYYRRGGDAFYAIGIPMVDAVDTFRAAGRHREAAALLADFCRHGDRVAANGLNLPPHEVNYEQTIVGPAVLIALECYLLTRESRYLEAAQQMLPALEAFNGRQPDHHLHDIAIRHWDGFWFGGRQMWGDTFPHYWSAATGWAFYRYWQATGDEAYRQRGREVLLNNLSAFRLDGSARCVYIYPDAVNGNPGRFWDPLANDQDWALVFLMQAARLDPDFVQERWGGRKR